MEANILAFGKFVSRSEAQEIIYKDYLCDICYARNYDTLEYIIYFGWKGLDEWTDKELEDHISDLLEENQT